MLDRREPDPYFDAFTGLVAARALTTAIVLGVFDSLHERPAAAEELADAIPGVAGTGLHRPEIEKRAEIVPESIHRRVSFFRFIAQSLA